MLDSQEGAHVNRKKEERNRVSETEVARLSEMVGSIAETDDAVTLIEGSGD